MVAAHKGWPKERGFHPFNGKLSKRLGEQLTPEDAYLSYYDVRVTKEDVDTLKNDWLTDNTIAFWEEYLEREELPKYPLAQIVLLRPSMAFMLKHARNPTELRSVLPNFTKTTHIFLPINDARNVELAECGSHWSLLLVSLIDYVAFHYDSMNPANDADAREATKKLEMLIGKRLTYLDLPKSPQQGNSSDCGVFVCMNMRTLLLKRLLNANTKVKIDMSMEGEPLDAAEGRKEIRRIIEAFRVEGQKRRSNDISRSSSPSHKYGSRSPPRIDSR